MLLAIVPSLATAFELPQGLRFSGFYTFDASVSKGQDSVFMAPSGHPTVLEEGKVSLDNTVVGLQADWAVTDGLSLTAQVISGKQINGNYTPSIEWAYASFDLGNDLSLRGGKFKVPFLQGTELRYVGYSRLWVRPVVPATGAGGFDDYQGVEILKSWQLEDYNLRLHGSFGKADHQLDIADNDNIKLISARMENDRSWISAALFHAQYDSFTPNRERVLQSNAKMLMASIEAEKQWDNYILNAGAAYSSAESAPDERFAYLSLGYRIGDFTPFALYHHRRMIFSRPNLPPPNQGPPNQGPSPGPPGSQPLPPPREGLLKEDSYILGVRYDLGPTYDVKLQAERRVTDDGTNWNVGGGRSQGTLFSIVFEGVF